MIRNEYRLTNSTVEWFLYETRYKRPAGFRANVSAREAHLNWLKRIAKNNKHTMGTWV